MPAVTVRTRDVLTLAKQFVSDDLDVHGDGPERSAACSERRADLLVGCRTEAALEHGRQLLLAELVVAADQAEHELALVGDDWHRLRRRRGVDREELRQLLDRRDAGRRDLDRGIETVRELRRTRHAARSLAIRGVVAVLAEHELVLARAGRRQEVPR